jgi:uncharacterized lipoprotein YmbA
MMRFLCLLLAITVAGCASQISEPRQYLLRSDTELNSRELATSSEFALGDIFIAPYIDQQGIVLEIQPGEMRGARQHLWAEPINSGIRIFLRQEISAVLNQDLPMNTQSGAGTQINIRIDQMHGTHDGSARLVAYWWLSGDGVNHDGVQFAETQALPEDGYTALVNAEKILLSKLANDIGSTLERSISEGE